MLKLLGALLLVAGSAGFGWCICRDMDRRAETLRLLVRAFSMLESEVGYSRLTLPEGLVRVGRRLNGGRTECASAEGGLSASCSTGTLLGSCFCKIGEQIRADAGITFAQAWAQELPSFLNKVCLEEKERELIRSFPDYTGFMDGQMQLRALEQFRDMAESAQKKAAGEADGRRKAVLSVSAAGGLLVAILMI